MPGTDVSKNPETAMMEKLIINGDISGMTAEQRIIYYQKLCESLGLNPITKPFDIITLSGKTVMYATKDAAFQLSKNNSISVVDMQQQFVSDLCITKIKLQDKTGRFDMATGVVNVANLRGDALANAIMKSETKAKRRGILSISGLGALDETEIETIPGVVRESGKLTPIQNGQSGGLENAGGDKTATGSTSTGRSDSKEPSNKPPDELVFKNPVAKIAHEQLMEMIKAGIITLGDVKAQIQIEAGVGKKLDDISNEKIENVVSKLQDLEKQRMLEKSR